MNEFRFLHVSLGLNDDMQATWSVCMHARAPCSCCKLKATANVRQAEIVRLLFSFNRTTLIMKPELFYRLEAVIRVDGEALIVKPDGDI